MLGTIIKKYFIQYGRCSSTSVRELSMERMDEDFEEVELDNIGVGV